MTTKTETKIDWSSIGTLRDLLKAKNAEAIMQRNYKTCECEIPHLVRKWNAALGTFVEIRLCCMAKALEQLTGGMFYEVFEFEPEWVWDCNETITKNGKERRKGTPPGWLLKRMRQKGIQVKNLE